VQLKGDVADGPDSILARVGAIRGPPMPGGPERKPECLTELLVEERTMAHLGAKAIPLPDAFNLHCGC